MIVKNEEKVLARCLDSIKDAVDEIIIADTGSTDATEEIARRYTDKVYPFGWCGDFSAARNFSFSKASKPFVMWLDADDVIPPESLNRLIALKKELESTDAVMMKYDTAFDENGTATFSYYRERIVRRALNPVWKGKVHEVLDYTGRTLYPDISVEHRPHKREYTTRNLEIYEEQLRTGGDFCARDVFYFARELYYHKKYDRAIQMLSSFLKREDAWAENKIEACRILSYCHSESGDREAALSALFTSFLYDSPRAEVCCDIGNLFLSLNEYKKAVYWFQCALRAERHMESGAFVDRNAYGYLPCIQLAVCYDRLKDYRAAEKYNELAGGYRPKAPAYLANLKYFSSLHTRGVL